ncbi:MAG: C4-dicarboxylate ABC transporter permease [Betaproteobacteria bacterium RIFCSPLOWO2_02_FULL_65_20]|nr:MAG: C4-dicarboxylate ABC transporter permease [Betaproteobacteria bacterium RIFCSPLOWO2_02_FULL_65_20]
MDKDLVAIGGFVLLFVLMLLRVPIGISMGIVGVGGFALVNSFSSAMGLLAGSPYSTITDFNFSIIPMFILMGAFAAAAGMSTDLFRASQAWLGHLRGGLAMSTIVACGGFAAINGSSVATAATMTRVALPELRQAGYGPGLSTGVIAAGGTLGIMIPPSVIFVLYGIMTQTDIGKLFISGIVPGVLGVLMYAGTLQFLGWRSPGRMPRGARCSWPQRLAAIKDIWETLLLFLFVIGGMYAGWFTVTEAASMGALGALIIGLAQRRLTAKVIMRCLVESLRTTAAIFMIVIGAYLFGYFLAITQTTQKLIALLVGLPIGAYGVLGIILVMYFILGAIMDELAMILLTVPIVFPVMMELGFDPVWFGVIIVMTVTLGLICPPVGMNVFVINSIARDVSLGTIYRGVMPFIVSDIVRLTILCAFPVLSLFLPRSMG